MKKINLIEWLSRNSHEKQSPQRFRRYAVMQMMLLTIGVGQMWADCQITNTNNASFYNTVTNSSLSLTNDDNNHYYGNLYVKGGTTYERKWVVGGSGWSNWYKQDRDATPSGNYEGTVCLNTGDGNDKFTTPGTTSKYYKLYIDLWCSYDWGSKVKFYYDEVSALSPSLSGATTAMSGGDTREFSSSCTGGSGGYTYAYTCRNTTDDTDASSALSATSGTSTTFTAPVAGTAKTYRITVTATDANSQLTGLGFSSKSTYKDITVNATLTPTIAWAASTPISSYELVSGQNITLNVTRTNSSNDIIFYKKVGDGSWEQIADQASTTYTYTLPANKGATQTYYFKAALKDGSPYPETSASSAVSVYGKKTIHVRNTNSWSNFYVYRYNSESDFETAWPGTTTGISAGDGQWKDVVMTSKYAYFIFNDNGSNQIKGSETYTYASSISDGGYYEIQESTGTNLTFTSSSEPAKPTVTTDDATASTSTSATFGAHLTAVNRDKVTTYGVIYKQSDSNIASAEALAAASPSSQSLGSNINSGTANNTTTKTITAGKDWYYAAFATNGKGTSYGDLKKLRTTAVTLDMQSGSGGSSSVVAIGGKAMPSATMPTRTGYTFGGYYTSTGGDGTQYYAANGSSATNWKTNGSASETLYAKWTANKYDVMLKLNGGTGTDNQVVEATYAAAMPTVLKTSGSAISIPTRTGYTLLGYWDATSGGNQYYSYNGTSLSSSRTWNKTSATNLYARWQANQYTLTLYKNDGGDTYTEETATYDATITVSAPTRTGYTFTGYWTTASDDGTKIIDTDGHFVNSVVSGYVASGKKWQRTSNTSLYARWTANSYTVTLKPNGGSGSDQTVSATYDAPMPSTLSDGETAIVAPTRTGYDFDGYWYSSTQYYDEDLNSKTNWNRTSATTLNAKWNAKSYTITLTQVGETGYGSAGTGSVSATYDAAMPAIARLPTPATGYKFQGYFTESNGGGTQFTDATGAWQPVADYVEDSKWVNAGTLELFAFFEKAELTSFEYSPSTVAPGHNMEITPVISPTPHGTTCVCWTLFYDSECREEVPGANYTIDESPSSGASSITLKAPTASGTYYLQGTLRTGSVCNAGDSLSTHKQACIVESDHKLTIRYICDNEVIRESRLIVVPAGDSVGVKAATIDGYTFSEWVLADVLQQADDDATGDSITIKARYDGTLTAKYIETPRVYFYNNLGWEDVYVTYDAYWDESNGTGNSGRPYHHMTRIEGTDIWYDNVPSAYTSSAFAGWASNIAFNDTELLNGGKNAPQESGDYGNYDRGKVIFRRDFDPYNTMFVPATSDIDVPFTKNGETATYYSSGISTYVDKWKEGDVEKTYTHYFEQGGYWKKYQKTYSGYSLRGTFGGIVEGDSNWNGSEHDLYASNTEDSVFTTSIDLNGNWNYYFSIYKNTLKNNESAKFTYNTATLTINTTHTDIRFLSGRNDWRDISGDAANGDSKHCKLTTATAGVYTFYVKYKKNGTLEVSVEYPDAPGNFQVLYSDNTTSEWFKSDVIESDAQDAKVSFFYRPGNSPVLKWKKSTAIANDGTITWGSDYTFDMSGFSSVLNHDSVYVFYLSNVDNILQMDSVKAYTGEYYIRTNCASKYKWDRYKDADHRMSYSEYSEKNSDYTHYFMKYAGKDTDVRFVVANEYSPAISDTLVQMDGDVSADPVYTHVSSSGSLAENANIRFMWNSHTNTVLRAYLAAAKDDGTQFLVMQGQNGKLYDENGNDLKNASNKGDAGYNHKAPDDAIQFSDIENWVYEANVKAKPGTFIKLYAKYDNGYFYYKGDNSATFDKDHAFTLLGGSKDTDPLDIRVVYDFKTDRLMAAYVPTAAAVTDTIAINADIMFIRHHQEAPTAITFGESSGKLDEVKTVYGVVRLNRWQISNRQHPEDDNVDHCKDQDSINKYHPLVDVGDITSEYERSFYFISFPFDVNLSEVIGFGTYGVHWGIMYYDGKGRAKNGYWADSEVNWKYFTIEEMRTKKLNAYEGYVIGIDPDLMYYTNTNIWTNNCSNLEIFFPSRTKIGNITKKAVTVDIDQTGYECKIDRRTQAEKDAGLKDINKNRTIADSYWHCIGVPTYADLTASIANVVSDTLERLEWGNKNLLYVYSWSKIDNSLTAVSAPTFEFETMKSYLVQYAGETISWAAASAGPQSIVARQRDEEEIHFAEFNLAILQNEEKQDQTFVRLSDDENITNDFDFNYDLGKSFNAGKANIYTLAEGYIQAAANCLPLSSQTTIVPVGVKIAKEGDYTFSIPEGTNGVGVTLIDNETGIRTSLSALDYTINLSAGTYNDRFVLEISPIQQMPTGVELLNGENGENGVRKVLIDGLLYIVKDGVIYDAQGKRVQ